ncbi:hypothetical protein [Nocardia xishanensis]|uniref:hypothetical protein n=1 Tax=Nocardia xishanensis TaxID=238964 RepID=UPI0008313147|nr:hypothetical protein [Nocardia xishanensis]
MYRRLSTVLAASALSILATGIANAEPAARLHEGMQVVGQDVQAGLYHTSGPRPDDYGACFIEWLPYKGAKSSELIDIESYTGASYVHLDDGDVVDVTGCVWIHE